MLVEEAKPMKELVGYNLLGLAVWWSEVDHLFSALFPYEGPAAGLGVIDVTMNCKSYP